MNPQKKSINAAFDTASQLHGSILQLSRLLTPEGAKGLSMAKLGVMGYLYREGTATVTQLAAYLRIQPQSLTRLVTDLEKQSWIKRRPSDVDHRQHLLEITDEGTKILINGVTSQRLELTQTIVDTLTPAEQEMLRLSASLIDRLTEALKARAPLPKEQRKRTKNKIR